MAFFLEKDKTKLHYQINWSSSNKNVLISRERNGTSVFFQNAELFLQNTADGQLQMLDHSPVKSGIYYYTIWSQRNSTLEIINTVPAEMNQHVLEIVIAKGKKTIQLPIFKSVLLNKKSFQSFSCRKYNIIQVLHKQD